MVPRGDRSLLPQIEPFVDLVGVRLGISIADLRSVRPATKHEPYAGLSENVGGYKVIYSVKGLYSERPASPTARIVSIGARRDFPKDTDASKLWQESLPRLNAVANSVPRCIRLDESDSGYIAFWRYNGGTLTLTVSEGARVGEMDSRPTLGIVLDRGGLPRWARDVFSGTYTPPQNRRVIPCPTGL